MGTAGTIGLGLYRIGFHSAQEAIITSSITVKIQVIMGQFYIFLIHFWAQTNNICKKDKHKL
jgi:hypothetical protein